MNIRKEIKHCWMVFLIIVMTIVGTSGLVVAAVSDIVTVVNMTQQNQFSPSGISVIAGTTVKWVNADTFMAHTATSDSTNSTSGGPNSDILFPNGMSPGQTYSWIVPTSAASGTKWYYHCRFHGQAGNGQQPGTGMSGSITVINAALPDIKANGQDGPITVSSNSPVSITIGLTGVIQAGILADWWLVESTPTGLFSWVNPIGWTPGLITAIQFPLVGLSTVEMFNGLLPAGDYAFYFGVDTTPDNVLNLPLYYDFVQIHVN